MKAQEGTRVGNKLAGAGAGTLWASRGFGQNGAGVLFILFWKEVLNLVLVPRTRYQI